MDNYKDRIKFNQQKDVMKLIISNNFKTPEELLEFLIRFCKEVADLFGGEIQASEEEDNHKRHLGH